MTSTEPLRLTAAVRDALLDHAAVGADRAPPEEVCGVLAGARGSTDRVTDATRVDNVAAHPRTEYELDPEATMSTIDRIEATGDDVVGFYHSHPESPAEPSATDRARATWTGYLYAIVSPPETIRAYRFTGEGFDEVPVQVDSRE
ncbi:desampylase [Haloplanus litoreus]|uniref:Desampylase n=1 Tax=Haloplanus litoreus TaxID=767515 RepID=A0ABD5ZUT7_9EURY